MGTNPERRTRTKEASSFSCPCEENDRANFGFPFGSCIIYDNDLE
jgi:hypothetical protein